MCAMQVGSSGQIVGLAALPQVKDLRNADWADNATAAWDWAFEQLLPRASRTVAYNLYHFAPEIHTNPESNATLASLDFAVQQRAFIVRSVDQRSLDLCASLPPSYTFHVYPPALNDNCNVVRIRR